MSQTVERLDKEIKKKVQLNYLLHVPAAYGERAAKRWPLLLFLHGSGERGDVIEKVKAHGVPKMVDELADFPFIAVSPQCPEDSFWNVELDGVLALLDEVMANYAVDPGRVYVTGLSMGGYGTWLLAEAYPERFAAIAPICGGGIPVRAHRMKDIPVWAFHGARDPVVKLHESEDMVAALQACGGNVRFTVYPEAGHDSWTETYLNPELFSWFLSHSRGTKT